MTASSLAAAYHDAVKRKDLTAADGSLREAEASKAPWAYTARIHFELELRKDAAAADEAALRAIQQFPGNTAFFVTRLRTLRMSKSAEESLSFGGEEADKFAENAEYNYEMGVSAREAKQLQQAKSYLETALSLQGDHFWALRNLLLILPNTDVPREEILQWQSKARVLYPEDERLDAPLEAIEKHLAADVTQECQAAFAAAEQERFSGNPKLALELHEKIQKTFGSFQRSARSIVDILLYRHVDRVRALEKARLYAERFPEDPYFYAAQILVLREQGALKEAFEIAEDLPEAFFKNTFLRYEIGLLQRSAGDFAAAVESFEAVLRLLPTHFYAAKARIEALLALGTPVESLLAQIDTLLQAAPAQASLHLLKADLFQEASGKEAALEYLMQLGDEFKENPEVLRRKALYLAQLNRFKDALPLLDALLLVQPKDRYARRHKIEVLTELSEHATLLEILQSEMALATAQEPADFYLIERALRGLPPKQREEVLRNQLSTLVALVPQMSASLLYFLSEELDAYGLARGENPFAASLMERSDLPLPEAVELLGRLFVEKERDWRLRAERLKAHVNEADRDVFEFEMLTLLPNTRLALKLRKKLLPKDRRTAQIIRLSELLVREGRMRVAARYLQFVARLRPRDGWIAGRARGYLIETGQSSAMRRALLEKEIQTLEPAEATSLYDLGEINRFTEAMAAQPDLISRRDLAIKLAEVLAVRGEEQAARNCLLGLRSTTAQQDKYFTSHLSTSLVGSILNEISLSKLSGDDNPLAFDKSLARINAYSQDAAPPEATHQEGAQISVMQYWNSDIVPREIRTIMASWEGQAGISLHRFNRRTAYAFLHQRLGEDWARAFTLANNAAEESDFFRLCYLMLEGGFYIDADDWYRPQFREILRSPDAFLSFREPVGYLGNNAIYAPVKHPAIVYATAGAKIALLQRHNDGTWMKTGPGLLTRATAWYLQRCETRGEAPQLDLRRRSELGSYVQYHTPLLYKRRKSYWNAAKDGALGSFLSQI